MLFPVPRTSHSNQQWRYVMNDRLYSIAAPVRHRGLFTLCVSFILIALLASACGSSGGSSSSSGSSSSTIKLYMIPKFTGIPPFTQADQGAQQFAQQFGYQLSYGGATPPPPPPPTQLYHNSFS